MTMDAMPDVHTLTGAYVCDALASDERAAFEAHLAQCPVCRQEVTELREVVAVLGAAAALEPPARLKAAVGARIAVTRQLPPKVGEERATTAGPVEQGPVEQGPVEQGPVEQGPVEQGPVADGKAEYGQVASLDEARARRRLRRSAWSGWAVAAALAGVLAVLGVHSGSQQQQINALSQQTKVVQQLLDAPDAHSGNAAVQTGGTAAVLDSRSRDEAVITFAGLAAPPPGKTYQLWMMGPGGARSGGLLPVPASGNPGPVVAHGLGDAKTIGLTIEPVHGSPQPTGPPILLLPMGT
ncbi:anti-sigma factor [Actinocrinis puniceicyclus]|uniref:Regulator of SigK n=1 Tax=Actinocrinis puniceicyclus TaxID=977794 RepID=A0A8J7WMQ0_9ACTN|nr:anti-sigma factor [Actinocrinis puniceicyclus]MBS2963605.1 anti-sigma factor [Actinocrinis puniceicyclus]